MTAAARHATVAGGDQRAHGQTAPDPVRPFSVIASNDCFSANAAIPPCVVPVCNEFVSCRSAVNRFRNGSFSIGRTRTCGAKRTFLIAVWSVYQLRDKQSPYSILKSLRYRRDCCSNHPR